MFLAPKFTAEIIYHLDSLSIRKLEQSQPESLNLVQFMLHQMTSMGPVVAQRMIRNHDNRWQATWPISDPKDTHYPQKGLYESFLVNFLQDSQSISVVNSGFSLIHFEYDLHW